MLAVSVRAEGGLWFRPWALISLEGVLIMWKTALVSATVIIVVVAVLLGLMVDSRFLLALVPAVIILRKCFTGGKKVSEDTEGEEMAVAPTLQKTPWWKVLSISVAVVVTVFLGLMIDYRLSMAALALVAFIALAKRSKSGRSAGKNEKVVDIPKKSTYFLWLVVSLRFWKAFCWLFHSRRFIYRQSGQPRIILRQSWLFGGDNSPEKGNKAVDIDSISSDNPGLFNVFARKAGWTTLICVREGADEKTKIKGVPIDWDVNAAVDTMSGWLRENKRERPSE